jgi:putative heme-binding domain-containing protein
VKAPLWILLLGALAGVACAQQSDPIATMSAADLERGQRLYRGHCALCHGQTAEGGRGPNLAVPNLRRAADNAALFRVIQQGVPGSEMDGAWQLTEREVWQVAAYLRSLGRVAAEPLPGNAARGKRVYADAGCAACHVIQGAGTGLGPELSEIGARRSAAYLRQSLLDPGMSAPEGFLLIRAVTRAGREIRGVRVNEDSFTLQLRDLDGRFHSLRKPALKEIKKLFGESPMPSYRGNLSDTQLDDLVAYLAILRGAQ